MNRQWKRVAIVCSYVVIAGWTGLEAGAAPQLTGTTYYGGAGDQGGTGASVSGGALYISGSVGGIIGSANAPDGLVARYALPLSNGAAPVWAATWPTVGGDDTFSGIGAAADGVYAAGLSYSRTSDNVGGKEYKGLVAKFPLTGATGPGFGGVTWERQTPAAPGAFAYGGIERLWATTVTTEAGQTVAYASGSAQSGGSNGERFFLSKLAADSTVLWTQTDTVSDTGSSGRGITVMGNNVYAAGFNLGSGYLRQFDSAGNPGFAKTGAPGEYYGVTSGAGAVYAVGSAIVAGQRDFLIEKWDTSGNLLYSKTYDRNTGRESLSGVVLVGNTLYAVGETTGNTAGGRDGILLELDAATGSLSSSTLFGGAGDDFASGVTTDGANIYVVGQYGSAGASAGNGAGESDVVLLQFAVPEPSGALLILALGAAGFLKRRRRGAWLMNVLMENCEMTQK